MTATLRSLGSRSWVDPRWQGMRRRLTTRRLRPPVAVVPVAGTGRITDLVTARMATMPPALADDARQMVADAYRLHRAVYKFAFAAEQTRGRLLAHFRDAECDDEIADDYADVYEPLTGLPALTDFVESIGLMAERLCRSSISHIARTGGRPLTPIEAGNLASGALDAMVPGSGTPKAGQDRVVVGAEEEGPPSDLGALAALVARVIQVDDEGAVRLRADAIVTGDLVVEREDEDEPVLVARYFVDPDEDAMTPRVEVATVETYRLVVAGPDDGAEGVVMEGAEVRTGRLVVVDGGGTEIITVGSTTEVDMPAAGVRIGRPGEGMPSVEIVALTENAGALGDGASVVVTGQMPEGMIEPANVYISAAASDGTVTIEGREGHRVLAHQAADDRTHANPDPAAWFLGEIALTEPTIASGLHRVVADVYGGVVRGEQVDQRVLDLLADADGA